MAATYLTLTFRCRRTAFPMNTPTFEAPLALAKVIVCGVMASAGERSWFMGLFRQKER